MSLWGVCRYDNRWGKCGANTRATHSLHADFHHIAFDLTLAQAEEVSKLLNEYENRPAPEQRGEWCRHESCIGPSCWCHNPGPPHVDPPASSGATEGKCGECGYDKTHIVHETSSLYDVSLRVPLHVFKPSPASAAPGECKDNDCIDNFGQSPHPAAPEPRRDQCPACYSATCTCYGDGYEAGMIAERQAAQADREAIERMRALFRHHSDSDTVSIGTLVAMLEQPERKP